jgi:hypothetical protein
MRMLVRSYQPCQASWVQKGTSKQGHASELALSPSCMHACMHTTDRLAACILAFYSFFFFKIIFCPLLVSSWIMC